MQQDDFEVTFCDLCGASVPVADLASGAAVKSNGKVVGACCLPGLRAARSDAPTVGASRAAPGESRMVVVAVMLLAAVAGATIFLDHRLAKAETAWEKRHGELVQLQRSDSDVLQAVGVDMDGAARRADVDELGRSVKGIENALAASGEHAGKEFDQVRQDVAALRQEFRTSQAAQIDYRPLFDDLRSQLQRQATAIADLRNAPPVVAVPKEADAPVDPPPAAPVDPALPPALAEQVRKLQSSDPAIRFEAVDELARSKDATVLPHLLPLVNDPDSFVRRVTMDGLAGFRAAPAVEALLAGLGDADQNVRDTAWRSLREVTGQKIPFDAFNPSKEVRARAQQRWQEWWDANKATFGGS